MSEMRAISPVVLKRYLFTLNKISVLLKFEKVSSVIRILYFKPMYEFSLFITVGFILK